MSSHRVPPRRDAPVTANPSSSSSSSKVRCPATSSSLRRRAVGYAVVGALLLAGCSSGGGEDLQPLRDDLAAQASAQDSLRARINEIETVLAAVTAPSDDEGDGLTELASSLGEIQTALEELRTQLETETQAREDTDAELLSGLNELDSLVQDLADTVEMARLDLQRLREDHELLKRRFDNHVSDGHGG